MQKIYDFVTQELGQDSSGHSIDHAMRVYNLAQKIQCAEGGDLLIIETAALLHDVIDKKLFSDIDAQKQKIQNLLQQLNYEPTQIQHVFDIMESISYSGGHQKTLQTLEAKIVQDADRLDAIGAIGVARTFMYGGAKKSKMYDEAAVVEQFESEEAYRNHQGSVIGHFYEKLFKLRDLMNTKTGRELANERHTFMEEFVAQFLKEYHSNI